MFESNDTFVEEAVKSKETTGHKVKKYVSLVMAVVSLLAAIINIFPQIMFVVFIVLYKKLNLN